MKHWFEVHLDILEVIFMFLIAIAIIILGLNVNVPVVRDFLCWLDGCVMGAAAYKLYSYIKETRF